MNTSFTPLSEGLSAAIYIANEWLLTSVREIMLNQVLLQGELLATFVAHPFFVYLVDFHVPFQTIFCFKVAFAGKNITFKSLLSISVLSHFYFDVLNSYNNRIPLDLHDDMCKIIIQY